MSQQCFINEIGLPFSRFFFSTTKKNNREIQMIFLLAFVYIIFIPFGTLK